MKKDKYYVYVYYDSSWTPIYIGLGCNNRVKSHLQNSKLEKDTPFYNKLGDIFNKKDFVNYRIIKKDINLEEASLIEEALINLFGKINDGGGTLYNTKDGGIHAPSPTLAQKVALYDFYTCKLIDTFKSFSACARFIGGNKGTIRDAAREQYPTTTKKGKFFIEPYDDVPKKTTNLDKVLEERIERRKKAVEKALHIPVTLTHVDTNEKLHFKNLSVAQKELNCCYKTLREHFNNKTLFRKVWEVSYDK